MGWADVAHLLPRATASGTTTAPPALTTVFSPAQSCTIDIYEQQYNGLTCQIGTSDVPCVYMRLGPSTSTSNCLPSSWSSGTDFYYSPGICPQGYTQACSNVNTNGTVEIPVTTATCCPNGYSCQTTAYWPWETPNLCASLNPSSVAFVYTTSIAGQGFSTATTTREWVIVANGVQIRYDSTDFITPTSTSSVSTSAVTTTTSSNTPRPTETSSSSSSGGLSSGAKAGIGVGVTIGGLLVLLGVFMLWRRQRRQAASAAAAVAATATSFSSPPPHDDNAANMSNGPDSGPYKYSGVPLASVSPGTHAPQTMSDPTDHPSEVPGDSIRSELHSEPMMEPAELGTGRD